MIKRIPSKFTHYAFSTDVGEHRYIFDTIKMKDSIFIVINLRNQPDFSDLAMALINRHSSLPVSTHIMGNFGEECSKSLALRLSKKLNKTVFMSVNVTVDKYTWPLLERQLFLEIRNKPEKF